MADGMTVDEFSAFLVGEAQNFMTNWKDEAKLDPEAYPPSMTRRKWLSEFNANLPLEQPLA